MGRGAVRAKERAAAAERRAAAGDRAMFVAKEDLQNNNNTKLVQKKVDEIIQDLEEGELLYAASWYRNYCRNKKLIDLTETPEDLKREIINNFMADKPDTRWMRRGKVFPYLVANRCNQLIESVQEFI